MRRLAFIAYFLLLALAIPWYWPANDMSVWFGVPAWVVVAIGVSLLASCLTAALMLFDNGAELLSGLL